MKQAYKFVAGNSRITPIGVAIAVVLALVFRHTPGWQPGVVFLGTLLVTLAAATFEPVQ